jgi:Kdo2-lipid IVA lauroyltransferase/acyltransferase
MKHQDRMAQKPRKSKLRELLYNFRYRCGEQALRGFINILPYIPNRLMLGFTRLMARATFIFMRSYRKRMAENIASVLAQDIPDPHERQKLVWRAWLNFAQGVLETARVMHFSREEIISTVVLEGEEHIQRALEKGKGVLALSAHLGSFTMIGARLAASGYAFSAVVKPPRDQRFAKLLDDYRQQIGIHTIAAKPRRQAVRGILQALRENRIVLIIADEFRSGDVMVDFFGVKVPAPRGPATLALRTKAATLPMFATRRSADGLTLSVDAPILPVESDDLEASVVATTAVYTRRIEAAIREYPDQWNWIGLPRRDGKMSRADMARVLKESRASSEAPAIEGEQARLRVK